MTERSPVVGLSVDPGETAEWIAALQTALSPLPVRFDPDAPSDEIDYLVYNIDGGVTDFAAFPRLKAILNTWAGVETVVGHVVWPEHVPFCRMVEPGLTEGMVEYFVGHVMRYHLDIDRFVADSATGAWNKWSPPLARDRHVGILGLGALGTATGQALTGLGFQVAGWSRNPKTLPGITCHHGDAGLADILGTSEILCVILPLTRQTENILDTDTLNRLPRGACLINAGRGPLIEDSALLAALTSGQVRHATLDVFREEPLPASHAFWRHPRITVTPHIAAVTRAHSAAAAIGEQIARHLDGRPLLHVVDSARGY